MQPVHVPPARRYLLDRPQRLGFLPTLWFWNDHERHRLALPLVLSLSLPWTPLLFFFVVRLQLSVPLFVVINMLVPYLAMGLIERHIRGELRRRALVGPAIGEALVEASPEDLPASTPALHPREPDSGDRGRPGAPDVSSIRDRKPRRLGRKPRSPGGPCMALRHGHGERDRRPAHHST